VSSSVARAKRLAGISRSTQTLGITKASMQRGDRVPETKVASLLAAVFTNAIGVYESYSALETPTRRFRTVPDLFEHITASRATGTNYFDIVVHYEGAGGTATTRRFDVVPEKCAGARWREKTEGWGLVSFQLAYADDGFVKGRIAANSEKRAHRAWEGTSPDG
jgi:hypothetical protein